MKTGTLTHDQVKRGTAAAIASIHISTYGQTKQIPLTHNLTERIEKVQKIGEMLERNRVAIINLNTSVTSRDPNSHVNLFNQRQLFYDKLRWQHEVRFRLLTMFDKAVKQLQYIS